MLVWAAGRAVAAVVFLLMASLAPHAAAVPTAMTGDPAVDQAALLYEVASSKLPPPLPTRPGHTGEFSRKRALQQGGEDVLDQQLDEATLARLAETIGTSKTLSNQQLDEMANKIKNTGLKHKINPDHPEKNLKKVIDQLTQAEREILKSRLHDL